MFHGGGRRPVRRRHARIVGRGGSPRPEEALELTNDEGESLRERLERIGFAGDATVNARAWDAWLELHIEQGERLTDAGAGVGIVETITGITNGEIEIVGEADHAGSTPMYERRDALAAASAFVLDLERAAEELATTSEAAVGTASAGAIEPNARNIVPERVRLQLDLRDVEHEYMDQLVERCRSSLARLERTRGVDTTIHRYRDTEPTRMAERGVAAAASAAATHGVEAIRLHSAAMHDTANVATVTDAALLFAPSEGGVSHSPRAWTDWTNCAAAVGVLVEAARSLAGR